MQIIPAIDLRAGKCVRLRQGDYAAETVFGDDPPAMAERWVQEGAERLHLVDLDGARSGRIENAAAVRSILERVNVPCQLGGGVRDRATVLELIDLGIERIVVGTRAVHDAAWFRTLCLDFPGRICLGIDARDGQAATEGWTRSTATRAIDLARQYDDLPLAAIIYTDISRDGMLQGANAEAMRELCRGVQSAVIASGGVTTLEDVRLLAATGVAASIVGRALYEGRLALGAAIEAARAATPPPEGRANRHVPTDS